MRRLQPVLKEHFERYTLRKVIHFPRWNDAVFFHSCCYTAFNDWTELIHPSTDWFATDQERTGEGKPHQYLSDVYWSTKCIFPSRDFWYYYFGLISAQKLWFRWFCVSLIWRQISHRIVWSFHIFHTTHFLLKF